MKKLLKIAWRNIWRSKRRTILTMTSIILAACMALFTRSMQKGSYGNMIGTLLNFQQDISKFKQKVIGKINRLIILLLVVIR